MIDESDDRRRRASRGSFQQLQIQLMKSVPNDGKRKGRSWTRIKKQRLIQPKNVRHNFSLIQLFISEVTEKNWSINFFTTLW